MTTTYTPSHPIVFVFDYDGNMEIPEYDSESVVSANDSCISIRTIADVDGDVTASLSHTVPQDAIASGIEVFRGVIRAPNRKVALVTSENQKLLELEVPKDKAAIRIFVDDELHPTKLWVEAR